MQVGDIERVVQALSTITNFIWAQIDKAIHVRINAGNKNKLQINEACNQLLQRNVRAFTGVTKGSPLACALAQAVLS